MSVVQKFEKSTIAVFQRIMNCQMDTEAVLEFSCVINIGFLILVTAVGALPFLTHQWTIEATVTELLLLIGAVMFNVIVMTAMRGNGNPVIGMACLLDILKDIERKLKCKGQLLCHQTSEVLKNMSNIILRYVNYFASSGMKLLVYSNSAFERIVKMPSKVHTPRINIEKTYARSRKANSEPMKTATNQAVDKGRFLGIKEKYMPIRSPELFKNKIYLTRRTLINAQDK